MIPLLSTQFQKMINSFSIIDSTNADQIVNFYAGDLKITSLYTANVSYVSNMLNFQDQTLNLQFLMPFYKENNLILPDYESKSKLLCYLTTSLNSTPFKLTFIIDELKECKLALQNLLQQFSTVYSSSQYKGLLYLTDYITNKSGRYEVNKADFRLHGFTPSTNYQDIVLDEFTNYDGLYIYSLLNEDEQNKIYTYYAMLITTDLNIASPIRIRLRCKVPQFMHIINSNNVRLRADLALHYNNYAVKCNELICKINSMLAVL